MATGRDRRVVGELEHVQYLAHYFDTFTQNLIFERVASKNEKFRERISVWVFWYCVVLGFVIEVVDWLVGNGDMRIQLE